MLGSLGVGTQSGGDAFICWVVFSESLSDAPLHYRGDALFYPACGFGFLVPYGGEAGHDIGTGDLVHSFVAEVGMRIGTEGGPPVLFGKAARFPFGGVKLDNFLGRLTKRWCVAGSTVGGFFEGLFVAEARRRASARVTAG